MDKNIQINFIKIFLKKYFFLNNFKKDILKNILFLPNLFCLFFKDKSIFIFDKKSIYFYIKYYILKKIKNKYKIFQFIFIIYLIKLNFIK